MTSFKHIDTKVIHSGEPSPRHDNAVVTPIYQSAMFVTAGEDDYHDLKYIRLNNTPNHDVLHARLAALENAEAGLVTASGMAAISTALITVLKSGDHLLIQDCVYGGTNDLLTDNFKEFGFEFDFIDESDPASWESKLKSNTKAIYVEAIANPMMSVPALKDVTDFAKSHQLVSMIDNTFTSPYNFRPAEWGFDLSIHSATKYLNGHSDIVAGAVIGRKDLVENVRRTLNHLGGTLDPHACFLLERGIKTLSLRIERQNASALTMARFLDEHGKINGVNYPGLVSSPDHERAKTYFDGFGGMLSFYVRGSADTAQQFMEHTRIPLMAPSLGGTET